MILLIAVAVILVFSLRWFDRRQIEDGQTVGSDDQPGYLPPETGPAGYERINSPPPQQGAGEGDSTQGLFLGAHTLLNYRSTQNNAQNDQT